MKCLPRWIHWSTLYSVLQPYLSLLTPLCHLCLSIVFPYGLNCFPKVVWGSLRLLRLWRGSSHICCKLFGISVLLVAWVLRYVSHIFCWCRRLGLLAHLWNLFFLLIFFAELDQAMVGRDGLLTLLLAPQCWWFLWCRSWRIASCYWRPFLHVWQWRYSWARRSPAVAFQCQLCRRQTLFSGLTSKFLLDLGRRRRWGRGGLVCL